MIRHKRCSLVLFLIMVSLVLAACANDTATSETDNSGATPVGTSGVATNPLLRTAVTGPMGAGAIAAATATSGSTPQPTAEAVHALPPITVPDVQGLRTDLKGASIKAILSPNEAIGSAIDRAIADKFTQLTGIQVELIKGELSPLDRLAVYRQQLSANSGGADVYMIGVTWPSILAEYAEDLKPAFGDMQDFFPAIVQNNTVQGKLVAAPYSADIGLLYYRKDLLEKYGFSNPPATWAELEQQAKKIQDGEREAGNDDFYGFVWQGKADETLTANALEWQASNGGGSIVEPDGTVSVNNVEVVAALNRAKGWIGTISPAGITSYDEEAARGIWQAGNAAFMRNWIYAYASSLSADSKVRNQFGIASLPKGEGAKARNADVLAGWQLMVNKNSQNKEAAIEFVKFLTSPQIQKANLILRGLLPVRPTIYDDPDVLESNPFYAPLKDILANDVVARPANVLKDQYDRVTLAYFTIVNVVLTNQQDTEAALADLENKLKSMLK